MKLRMVKVLAGTLLLLVLGGGLVIAAPAKVETVTIFSSIGAWKALLESQIAGFNSTIGAQKGIQVDMETNIDNSQQVLMLALKSGNPADLFIMANGSEAQIFAGGYVKAFEDIPALKDLVTRLKPYSQVKQLFSFAGKTYAFPLEVVPIKMAYNKALFKKAGIVDKAGNPTPPKTWDEVRSYAKRITDAGGGKEFGYGLPFGWSLTWRRLVFKAAIPAVGHFWFDNSTGRYNFKDFKPAIEFVMGIKADKSYFPGAESIQIDPIRAQFAEGRIGMMVAPSYDIGVYNDQFPAKMDWDICELPVFDQSKQKYKSPMLQRQNFSISSSVTNDHLAAVVEVFKFLNSKEFLTTVYENCGIIPIEMDIINSAKNVKSKTGWKNMSDLSRSYAFQPFPDSLITVEGLSAAQTLDKVWAGEVSIDAALADLDKRYNDALDSAVKSGKLQLDNYIYKTDLRLK
jgi:multiple sugar transport system substrate-binding protein